MQLNRIKVVLVENRSNKWLAQKLGKNEATVSRWRSNGVQPSLKTLTDIVKLLNINITDLIKS